MLTCDQLVASFSEEDLFEPIGFSLYPGAQLILTGANGSGKTTLLKMIAAIYQPTRGEIYWNNINIREISDLYRSKIAYYSGAQYGLKTELTVFENLEFWAKITENEELLMAAMAHFRLFEIADMEFYLLSDGWKKRVALAKMIISDAELWLLDEPETHLDDEGKWLLSELIKAKTSQGGIAIIATHTAFLDHITQLHMVDFIIRMPTK